MTRDGPVFRGGVTLGDEHAREFTRDSTVAPTRPGPHVKRDLVRRSLWRMVMAKFVIERHIPGLGKLTPAELKAISLKSVSVLREMGPQIQWLHSYVTEDKLYCVYLAPDEGTVREHARRGGFPVDRVAAVRRLIDPGTAE